MRLDKLNEIKFAIDNLFLENTIMKAFIYKKGLLDEFCSWQIQQNDKFEGPGKEGNN